jgi:hypothetical protein
MIRHGLLALLVAGWAVSAAFADAPRTIAWDDLVPAEPVPVDPFAQLTMNQRVELSLIAAARDRNMRGFAEEGDGGKLDARNLSRKLRSEGLDVEALLAEYDEFQAKAIARGNTPVDGFDAQTIRMPGYVLPLEFAGTDVTEFLLVPYVGACIHVPPPPPNQIVYVRARQPFKSEGLFAAIWVTGRMTVGKATRSLSLVDGTASVSTAYTMEAVRIEPYKD